MYHHSDGCEICGDNVLPDWKEDDTRESQHEYILDNDYCVSCQGMLRHGMTKKLLYGQDDIIEAINSIQHSVNKDKERVGGLSRGSRSDVLDKVVKLKSILGCDDIPDEEIHNRRDSLFLQAKFTYNRHKANIARVIEEAPVVNNGMGSKETLPWKLLDDEGSTTGEEGHSRASLIIEVPSDAARIRAHSMMKLEGAIDGGNGDRRNNCSVSVERHAPDWFWQADWGINKQSELEDE